MPEAVWIDETGRIVRPPENAGWFDGFRKRNRTTGDEPANAGSWPPHQAHAGCRHRSPPSRVPRPCRPSSPWPSAALRKPNDDIALAHAHFRLGSHLLQSGKDAAARHHVEQARRLHPESWNIWRQTHSRNELGFASGPEFWARVDALGERRYYEKVNIEGIPRSATLPKLPTARSHAPIAANGEPHSEGAGDQMAIVLFSFRGVRGDMILYLDKAADVSFRLGLPEFKATLAHQIATGATAKLGARAA